MQGRNNGNYQFSLLLKTFHLLTLTNISLLLLLFFYEHFVLMKINSRFYKIINLIIFVLDDRTIRYIDKTIRK